jgi:hypothetical protein
MNTNFKIQESVITKPEQPINSQGAPKTTTGPPINKNPTTNNKKSSNNNKPEVKLLTIFNLIPVFLHTFVKIMPVGLYLASFLESMLFNDIRGFLIFIGLLVNDLINIGYNYMMKPKPNMNCAIIRNVYTDDFFSFATPHTQYISFITAFLMASMYFKKVFYYSTFFMFVVMIGLTIWSRITIGCKDILGAGFNLLFGAFRGIIFYIIVKDFYEPEDVTPEDHWIERKLKALFPNSDNLDEMFQ